MSLPRFSDDLQLSPREWRTLVVDRIRAERRRLGMSQQTFADKCDIPLRTYKRFELDLCDSLDVLIKIVCTCGRTKGLELLFVPTEPAVKIRTPIAAMERLNQKIYK